MSDYIELLQRISALQVYVNNESHSYEHSRASTDVFAEVTAQLNQIYNQASDIASLTGPAGHNPQPALEKCSTCQHYRMR